MTRDIVLFGEDRAHEMVVEALVARIAEEGGVRTRRQWRNATGGHGRVARQLDRYLRDLRSQGGPWPDLIVVATDANCQGFRERVRQVTPRDAPAPIVRAVPDPHVERWLLLDGAAFKAVFGQGCKAPDRKCNRNQYKDRLIAAIRAAGSIPLLGGIEHAADIIGEMDIDRCMRRSAAERLTLPSRLPGSSGRSTDRFRSLRRRLLALALPDLAELHRVEHPREVVFIEPRRKRRLGLRQEHAHLP